MRLPEPVRCERNRAGVAAINERRQVHRHGKGADCIAARPVCKAGWRRRNDPCRTTAHACARLSGRLCAADSRGTPASGRLRSSEGCQEGVWQQKHTRSFGKRNPPPYLSHPPEAA